MHITALYGHHDTSGRYLDAYESHSDIDISYILSIIAYVCIYLFYMVIMTHQDDIWMHMRVTVT
jgi:uncharacterized protein (DUF983 family)